MVEHSSFISSAMLSVIVFISTSDRDVIASVILSIICFSAIIEHICILLLSVRFEATRKKSWTSAANHSANSDDRSAVLKVRQYVAREN